jgi:hypothetical protein
MTVDYIGLETKGRVQMTRKERRRDENRRWRMKHLCIQGVDNEEREIEGQVLTHEEGGHTKARDREISVEKSEQDEYRLRTHPSAKRDDEVGTEGILGGERKTKTTGQSTEGQRTEEQRTEGQSTEIQ